MFVEDYVDYINFSKFHFKHCQGTFETKVPSEILQQLNTTYPNVKHFQFSGIMMHLTKGSG